jgi:hypothetical protein
MIIPTLSGKTGKPIINNWQKLSAVYHFRHLLTLIIYLLVIIEFISAIRYATISKTLMHYYMFAYLLYYVATVTTINICFTTKITIKEAQI